LADRLCTDLEKHNYDPWLDRSEIQAGDAWAFKIEKAIDRSDALLALWTPGSYYSRICRGEQSRALRKGKLVIPILAHAKADRPIYLEDVHYLDFTRGDYDTNFTQLVHSVENKVGVNWRSLSLRDRRRLEEDQELPIAATEITDAAASWEPIRKLANTQLKKFLDNLSIATRHGGVYEPNLFVPRVSQWNELDRYLASDSAGLIVLGPSGVGKTTLLCHWARKRSDDGHAILMYNCGEFINLDIDQEIAADLGFESQPSIHSALTWLDKAAARFTQKFVITFDSLNDFRGRNGEGPGELVKAIDYLINRLALENIRFILSCSTPTWTRLDRRDELRLHWNQYHQAGDGEHFLLLEKFTDDETKSAYRRYRQHFDLQTPFAELPSSIRLRLRDPFLLRLLAEVHQGRVISEESSDTALFQRYYEQRVRRRAGQFFLDKLVNYMRDQGRTALSVQHLVSSTPLGPDILSEEPDATYNRLLDNGILTEIPGNIFEDDLVKFTYPLIGAFVLAKQLLQRKQGIAQTIAELADQFDRFPIAWDTATTLLLLQHDRGVFAKYSDSSNPDLRELMSETLMRLHGIKPTLAKVILNELLESDSPESQRTALNAAYRIGPATRGLFLRASTSGSPTLRKAVKDTLYLIWRGSTYLSPESSLDTAYLIWRHDPEFTYGLMHELVERLEFRHPKRTIRILKFVMGLSITIYINHCEQKEVAQRTAELYYEIAVVKLRLKEIKLGKAPERVFFNVIAAIFAKRILHWMLLTELTPAEKFFRLPPEKRVGLKRLAPLLDPGKDINGKADLLVTMLQSETTSFRGVAAAVLAVHSYARFEAVKPLHRELFERLGPEGRLWQLLSFSVLLPQTPSEWTGFLEEMTARLFSEQPQLVFDQSSPILAVYDLAFVPLGLAYGKQGRKLPLFDKLLNEAEKTGARQRAIRIISGLAPLGFYYPRAVLRSLRPVIHKYEEPEYREALLTTLATMRTLHLDLVDDFLVRAGTGDAFRHQIAGAATIELIQRYIYLLGFYNNAVHYCLFYPKMRRTLAIGGLTLLADSPNAKAFVVDYAFEAMRMLREADFQLLEWTREE